MTLRNARIGGRYTVNSIDLDQVTVRRLGALGLTRGTDIMLLHRNHGGSVVIMVRGSRLAIGKRFAECIEMEESRNAD